MSARLDRSNSEYIPDNLLRQLQGVKIYEFESDYKADMELLNNIEKNLKKQKIPKKKKK